MFKKHRILQGLHRVKYGDAWRPGADSNDLPTSAATRGCHVHAIAHYPTIRSRGSDTSTAHDSTGWQSWTVSQSGDEFDLVKVSSNEW